MRRLLAVALLLGGLLLAGCSAATPHPTTTSASAGLITPLSIGRSGGIAGQRQSLSIAADGSWIYTDAKTGTSTRGQLTSAQSSALVTLLTDPALITVLSNHPTDAPIVCTDGLEYTLQFGSSDTFTFLDCGSLPPPVQAVIQELVADTPL
jgi:hypothetical protein